MNMKKYKNILVLAILLLVIEGCGTFADFEIGNFFSHYIPLSEPEEQSNNIVFEDEQENRFLEVILESVVDGDTLKVRFPDGSTRKIRLLSVNAEESVSSDKSKNNEYGVMASDFLKEYLLDTTTLWMQYDTKQQDQYGRDLCYVWLSDQVEISNRDDIENYMLNAILLKNGYVYTVIYEPNRAYQNVFFDIEKSARNSNSGLWRYDEFHSLWNEK